MKDICPYCEKAEPIRGATAFVVKGATVEAECFYCPSCGGKFMTTHQVENLIRDIIVHLQPTDEPIPR